MDDANIESKGTSLDPSKAEYLEPIVSDNFHESDVQIP